jgi:ribosomal protein L29
MMSIDAERFQLYETARAHWGEEAATALMNALPPDRDQLATKADIRELTLATKADLGEVRSELALHRTETKAELASVRSELAEHRAEIKAGLANLRAEIHRAMGNQTRTLVLTLAGFNLTTVGLAFTAARLAA